MSKHRLATIGISSPSALSLSAFYFANATAHTRSRYSRKVWPPRSKAFLVHVVNSYQTRTKLRSQQKRSRWGGRGEKLYLTELVPFVGNTSSRSIHSFAAVTPPSLSLSLSLSSVLALSPTNEKAPLPIIIVVGLPACLPAYGNVAVGSPLARLPSFRIVS